MLRGGGAGGERGGESQGQDPLPLLQLGSYPGRLCPPPPISRKPREPQSREARMRTWLETDATHWRRSRRTPSSSDTSSGGCEWAWLRRRLGLSCCHSLGCPCGLDSHPPPNCPYSAVSLSNRSNLSLDIGHHDFVTIPFQQKCSAAQIWDCHPTPTPAASPLLRAETLNPIPGDH